MLPPCPSSFLASRSSVSVALRRFATESYPIAATPLASGQVGVLHIPTDRAGQPWEVALRSRAAVTVC